MRSSASSFNLQYPLFSLSSYSSCLLFLPCLPATSSLYLSFNNVLQKTVPTQDMTNPVNLPSFLLSVGYSSLSWIFLTLLHSHIIGPADLLHLSPAPHFKTSQVFLIYRVSIKSFPDYKHLLQENHVEYKHMQL